MTRNSVPAIALAALLLPVLGIQEARADFTYTYTGNAFTNFGGGDSCSGGATGTGECSLRGSFTVATAIAANIVSAQTIFLSFNHDAFSFTDGVNTLSNTNLVSTGSATFEVDATDANGIPTAWVLDILDGPNATSFTLLSVAGNSNLTCGAVANQDISNPFQCPSGTSAWVDSSGTWTMSGGSPPPPPPPAVPEPSSLAQLGSLLGIGCLRLHRKE